MKSTRDYKRIARGRLQGNWTPAVLASLIYTVLAVMCSTGGMIPQLWSISFPLEMSLRGGSTLLSIFLIYPLGVGVANAFRLFYERRDDRIVENMFELGFSRYWHKVAGMFLMEVKLFLWTLLFVIPGFVMAFAYAMTPYILEEHPEIDAWEASNRSREMMRGHKWQLFCLHLSFIGWFLLCILSLGIGFLWLGPFVQTAEVAFYNDLKAELGEEAVTE
ncbi:MAG: DUF975 family protein [Bacteroidales bacterium]|nr:DUF975 family protein [Bacteroidales bacterium]